MRKVVLSLAAAGAALVAASPAAAQFYPQPQPNGYGYGQPQGYGYGVNNYRNSYGQVRALQARIDRLQWQIERFQDRSGLRNRDSNRLRKEARRIEDRLQRAQRFGLNPMEANDIQMRLTQLEQQVRYMGGYNGYNRNNGYNGYNGYNGSNGYSRDRDNDHDHDRGDGRRDRDDD
jgi:hypothetical protein